MKVVRDEDIGLCDDCGSDEGKRLPTTVGGRFNDGPAVYRIWLCARCRSLRRKETTGAA